jgi:ketosteroid isomerase-like protein
MFDALNDGDLATVLRVVDEEIVWIPLRSAIEGPYRGHEGIRKWWGDTATSFETFQTEMHEYRDVGENQFIARGVIHTQGRGGGVPLGQPMSWSGEWRGLRITKTTFYFDHDGAPRAVGLDGW